MRKRSLPIVTFSTAGNAPLVVRGRNAETLLKLIDQGQRGITAYSFAGGPPFRLGAYVHNLRGLGLSIETRRVEHDVGWHAKYVLHTPVTVTNVQGAAHV